jgi:hypothetical protein
VEDLQTGSLPRVCVCVCVCVGSGPVYGFQWRHWGAKYVDMHTDYSGRLSPSFDNKKSPSDTEATQGKATTNYLSVFRSSSTTLLRVAS